MASRFDKKKTKTNKKQKKKKTPNKPKTAINEKLPQSFEFSVERERKKHRKTLEDSVDNSLRFVKKEASNFLLRKIISFSISRVLPKKKKKIEEQNKYIYLPSVPRGESQFTFVNDIILQEIFYRLTCHLVQLSRSFMSTCRI